MEDQPQQSEQAGERKKGALCDAQWAGVQAIDILRVKGIGEQADTAGENEQIDFAGADGHGISLVQGSLGDKRGSRGQRLNSSLSWSISAG